MTTGSGLSPRPAAGATMWWRGAKLAALTAATAAAVQFVAGLALDTQPLWDTRLVAVVAVSGLGGGVLAARRESRRATSSS